MTRAKILEVEKRKARRPKTDLAANPRLCDFLVVLIQMKVVQTVLKLQTMEPMRSHSLKSTLSYPVPNCVLSSAAKLAALSWNPENLKKLSLNAYLQVFATKMPYLRF